MKLLPQINLWKWRPVRVLVHLLLGCLAVLAIATAFNLGLTIRRLAYDRTNPIRHTYDTTHNLYYGRRAIDEGILNLYGNVRAENKDGDIGLDYVPLRLIAMREWAVWVNAKYGKRVRWREDFEFISPLLHFNTAMEVASAIAAFLLVRLWIRRSKPAPQLNPWTGFLPGGIAALLIWFSPAVLISAYGWPSWDIWVVPFFLWAVLLASLNAWFSAGALLAIGTMFKGQQLMMVPLFLLWPLFMGRLGAMLRWSSGYLLLGTLIVLPWLVRDEKTRVIDSLAIEWLIAAAFACALLICSALLTRYRWWQRLPLILASGLLLIIPWLMQPNRHYFYPALIVVAALLALSWRLPPRHQGYLIAGILGLSFASCPIAFSSDMSWWDVSFRYGSEKFDSLTQYSADTFPSLLGTRFHFRQLNDILFTVNLHDFWPSSSTVIAINLKLFLVSLYSIGLVLCAAGMAIQTRRKDRHFLAAMAAPWMLAFVFMPRMHSRYLLFGASVGAVAIGIGPPMILLDLFLIFISTLMTTQLLLGSRNPALLNPSLPDGWAHSLFRFTTHVNPDMAWAIILTALIFVYVGLTPTPKEPRTK